MATTIIRAMWVIMEEYYFLKRNQHVFNECLYVSRGKDYVMQHITTKVVVKTKLFIVHPSFICFFKVGPWWSMNKCNLCLLS
jgi:hypothetical protein